MLVGLDIEIAYANIGPFDNPQALIVGARYNYFYKNELQMTVSDSSDFIQIGRASCRERVCMLV